MSNFLSQLSAVALGMPPSSPISDPGNLYLGANMEFPNEALSLCVHATKNQQLYKGCVFRKKYIFPSKVSPRVTFKFTGHLKG